MQLIVLPEDGVVPVVAGIRSAKKTLDIPIFRLDHIDVDKAIKSAVKRGVVVRTLIAHTNSGGEKGLRKLEQRLLATGATVAGRGTFEPAGGWGGDHHDGVPIFIVSRHEPPPEFAQMPLVTYVDDVTTAMTRAKEAAGERNVLVHGAGTAQLALAAGVLDELELHVIPVLFGQGRRLFEGLAPEQIELERTRVLEGEGGVTHMHYRVGR